MAVSLALRSSPRISSATRERILKIAQRLDYRPNPLVQTLMANLRSSREQELRSTLAWVTAFPTKDGWSEHWVHRQYYEGACERAHTLGYKIEPIWAFSKGMSGKRLSDVLRARGIVGIIVPPVGNTKVKIELNWEQYACATIGYSFMKPTLHRSAAHISAGMELALRHCHELGYRRIGFVNPEVTDSRVHHKWMAAYLVWQQFNPKNTLPMLFVPKGTPIENLLEDWVNQHHPDVIISPNSEFLIWLPQIGWRVPEDIGVVSLNRSRHPLFKGKLAGINQKERIVAGGAVDLVVSQMQRNELGLPEHPRVVLTEGVWEDGPSLLPSRNAKTSATKS